MEFEPKGILKIEGSFFVPDYQRGYRWGTSEVELLLNDITENGKQLVHFALGEVDGENQENTYIHDSFALDAGYANYIRETVPKTVWSNDYLRELWDENAKYLKSIRESKNGYGFDDIGMGAAYTYSTMYQKIVEGYRNGTREVYVCDDSESGKRRLLLMDEELEKLNKGFDELIKWDKMVAKSQKQNAEKGQIGCRVHP